MPEWGAQNIQLVWFLASSEELDASEIYTRAWGEVPDHVQKSRVPHAGNPFLSVASHSSEHQVRHVQYQPGRLDIVCQAGEPDSANPFGRLQSASKTLSFLLEHIRENRITFSNVIRLSIILHLIKPVSSYGEGGVEFYKNAGMEPRYIGETDLFFQINMKKKFGGIWSNRIVQYSVASIQGMELKVGVGGTLIAQGSMSALKHAAAKQYDFNTVPDGRVFTPTEQIAILSELSSEVLMVDREGGLPRLMDV